MIVATHDVAIKALSVPSSGKAGSTGTITVSILDKRYPETVQVDLYGSVPGGSIQIDSKTVAIAKNKTVNVVFTYTFTATDALVGKVTFRAIATLTTARDALPADNEAISPPVKVKGK